MIGKQYSFQIGIISDFDAHSCLTLFIVLVVGVTGHTQQTTSDHVNSLLQKYLCIACHKVDSKLIGPSYIELSQKGHSVKEISALIIEPKPSNWPAYPPMAPMPHLPKEDVKKIASWIVSLGELRSK